MYFNLIVKKNVWFSYNENGRKKRKKISHLTDEYQIRYGLSFYDGPRRGIVVRLQDEKRFFFISDEDKNGNRIYVLFDLTNEQWQSVDREIHWLETFGGTHCRYVNGRRITNNHQEYKYVVTDESWKQFFKILNDEKIGHSYLNLSKNQTIGFVADVGF